ncbi:ATP-dependent DNA helicase RecG [Rhodocyclus tenuis]|uniref:Probable DNA 3'-5' helicase RecG n=1 Tax=Rhodocyclus gracilis TaxID=2929842 RepID=A0ABX0WID7_9RHOO|nr:ATP-dependent DNA helicase RecG [Rhodocyclus gracilis]NJA88606.1 ATP-dependent DNA helicase RecG [Rhodocyclus gracilis]
MSSAVKPSPRRASTASRTTKEAAPAARTALSDVPGASPRAAASRAGAREKSASSAQKASTAAMPPDAEMLAVSPALRGRLLSLGLRRQDDLVLHLPLRYEDETSLSTIAEAAPGVSVQLEVEVLDVSVQYRPRRQLLARTADATGTLTLRFLNFYGSQTRSLENVRDAGRRLRVFGELRHGFLGAEMVHPRCVAVDADAPLPTALTPVYPATAGVSQAVLRRLVSGALKQVSLDELFAPGALVAEGGGSVAGRTEVTGAGAPMPALWTFADAVRYLHAPPPAAPEAALQSRDHPAWQRIKFDELLAQQLSLQRASRARRRQGASVLAPAGALAQALLASLPFPLTGAQRRVVEEIRADLAQPWPMQRLLQGDVGSGKTIVAALAACQAIEAGYQAAFMAPTEILAEQHYLKLTAWLSPLGVSVVWLTGSLKKSQKRAMQAQAAAGAQLVIGTHALIQEDVDFVRLGLAIVDEQHRFGVAQRLELRRKGGTPHQLMMSATPIPRTLAMSYYADLDVSTLDELPPGRTPIKTRLVSDARRDEVIARLRGAVAGGRQAYWVCPLIEESEKLQLQTAIDTHATLVAELGGLTVGLVHGRMKAAEKAATMAAFAAGDIHVLVATTVIEVGVDVPNASLMVIEHAERFGLSQLHQLRGRVGRGAAESACVLLYQGPLSPMARERLRVMHECTDGFEIARQDLHLRGPGEFVGSRQSGTPLLRYADLEADTELIELARDAATRLLSSEAGRAAAERHLARWIGWREELLKA